MRKKLNHSTVLLMISCVLLFTLSCKKDQSVTHEDALENAKAWYLKANANSTSLLKSNHDDMTGIKQEVKWDNAKVYGLADGTALIGAPVSVKLGNGKETGSYMLLITPTADTYKSIMAYNEKKDYFNGSFSDSEMQTLYKNSLLAINAHKNKSAANKSSTMVLPEPPPCIDWYWTTTFYDQDGNVIFVDEVYLYTTCDGSGGNGGNGPTPPPEIILNFGIPVSDDEGGQMLMSSDTARSKKLSWVFNDGDTYKFKSREIGYQVKFDSGGGWNYINLEHESHYVVGNFVGGSVSIDAFNFSKNVSLKEATAYVEWRTQIVIVAGGSQGTHYGDYESSFHRWGENM